MAPCMTECVSAYVHPDLRAVAVLGTCSWAVTSYALTKEEGVVSLSRVKESRRGAGEIERERERERTGPLC